MRLFPPAGVLVLLIAGPASAQPPAPADVHAMRYELGQRLKRFEAQWEKHENPESRRQALATIEKVTPKFFAGELGEAGRAFDFAGFALISDDGPSISRQWAWSLYAVPEVRVIDDKAKEISVTIKQLYAVKGEKPKGLELQLWFSDKQVTILKPDKFPLTVRVPMPPLGEFKGLDRRLYFMVESGKELRHVAIGVSQVADLQTRLKKVSSAPAKKEGETIEDATARRRAALVTRAADNKAPTFPPTDLPYAEFLANAEKMLDGKPFFTHERPGQFWMSVPVGRGAVVDCRVFVPRDLDPNKPVPVVIALHGAGADENTFFEGYGAGQIVKECRKRGWVLVAPHGSLVGVDVPPVPELVEKLRERYPLDPKRVFLVGHSLGAVRTLDLAQANPEKFAGVAALGGGKVAKPAALAAMPLFLGVGKRDDLALAPVRALNKALTDGGAKKLTYKEYPHVEHLVIVREALPDVFTTFDEAAK